MKALNIIVAIALALGCAATSVDARVVRIEVKTRRAFDGGRTFGDAGAFEELQGTVYLEVDPKNPLDAVIVDLDKAPRNARGMVEFSTAFVLVKPVDMSRGNRKIVYGLNNRGNNIEFSFQSFPPVQLVNGAPATQPPNPGDGLIFKLGYVYVDSGWAGDIETANGRLGATLPIALDARGHAIVAPIRVEYQGRGYSLPLKGNRQFRTYATADTDTKHAKLNVRDSVNGRKTLIAPDQWAYGTCPMGKDSLMPSKMEICLFDGFQADKIYELTYPAEGPWVMGLGYAVTRDIGSFLRSAIKDDAGNPNPLADNGVNRITGLYGLGTSSTGMYLRDFIYLGFNEDEAHHKVFDAVRIALPGTHRLFANTEFADPNVYSSQNSHADFLSHSYPPLTYAVTTDPISGIRDGILKRPATDPFVFHVDTANEFWQMNASHNTRNGRGEPVPIPDNVRLYFLASHPHLGATGVGASPTNKAGRCEQIANGRLSYTPVMRALLVALDAWADRGELPPPSQYPGIGGAALGSLKEVAGQFPNIPGVHFPEVLNELVVYDFGRRFTPKGGFLTGDAPRRGTPYATLLPMTDSDGLDKDGIRTVDVAVPIGTNTGWNVVADGPRRGDLCGLGGSYIPFAKSKAERKASGDSRPSIEERYVNHDGFVRAVDAAARKLVSQHFMLAEDAETTVEIARVSKVLQ